LRKHNRASEQASERVDIFGGGYNFVAIGVSVMHELGA
jgi:hypothetical protein